MSDHVTRGIDEGDPRPRIFVTIEAAVDPRDASPGAVETLHDWMVGRVADWFTEDVAINVATYVEPSDQEDD